MLKLFKWIFYYCLFFGVIGFAVSLTFSQFPVLETGAKGYVMALKEKKHYDAYGYMSSSFRQKVTYQEFIQGLKDTGLYYAVKWEEKQTELSNKKTTGVAVGFITTQKGDKIRKIPVEIRFVHEPSQSASGSKGWYVQSISEIEIEDAKP